VDAHLGKSYRGAREVEDGFVSNEHDVKGHFFRGVEMRC